MNSSYLKPLKYWKFSEEDKPHQIIHGHRSAGYVVSDLSAKKPSQDMRKGQKHATMWI